MVSILPLEQLANVGCDIERTIQWKKKGDIDYSAKSFERAMELLDLTIFNQKIKVPLLKNLFVYAKL